MMKVGLTGGIGSGKSFIRRIFFELGIPVYDADSAAKRLMVENKQVRQSLEKEFGETIFNTDGTLNKKNLAEIVFKDKEKLQRINTIVHPAVRNDFEDWANKQKAPYVLEEAAVLFENNAHRNMDKVITVCASEDIRIERVIKRDAVTKEQVVERMKMQMPDEEKAKLSDFVIYNDNDHILLPQVIDIHFKLLETVQNMQ